MKVKELIAELLKCDPELEVVHDRSEDFAPINHESITGVGELVVDYSNEKYEYCKAVKVVALC